MFPKLVDPQTQILLNEEFRFLPVATNSEWQIVKGTGGALAIQSLANGIVAIPTAASASDYQGYWSQAKVWKMQAKLSIWAEVVLYLTEQNTNMANISFGFSSVTTTGNMQTSNGGPLTTFDGAIIYKLGGTSVWGMTSSAAAVQTNNANIGAFVSGTTPIRLGLQWAPIDATNGTWTPFINGVPFISTATGTATTKPYQQTVAYSATGALFVGVSVMAGTTATNAETLFVDRLSVAADR